MEIERRIDLSYGAAKALDMLHDGRQECASVFRCQSLDLTSNKKNRLASSLKISLTKGQGGSNTAPYTGGIIQPTPRAAVCCLL
jgi:rare lipoprotein A (peptidoglycan hydrolase)